MFWALAAVLACWATVLRAAAAVLTSNSLVAAIVLVAQRAKSATRPEILMAAQALPAAVRVPTTRSRFWARALITLAALSVLNSPLLDSPT